jgi:hypothetical protein
MDEAQINKLVEKAQAKDTLKQMFELTLDARTERWCEIKPHNIIPNSHFAAVSAECYELYRDGHFYGAISLSQSVAEALLRFLCEKNGIEPDEERYWENIKKLKKFGIDEELLKLFKAIRQARNDYHHLNPAIETDVQASGALAKEKLQTLQAIESEIFAYTTNEGKINPAHPQYWDLDASTNTMQVYLRID